MKINKRYIFIALLAVVLITVSALLFLNYRSDRVDLASKGCRISFVPKRIYFNYNEQLDLSQAESTIRNMGGTMDRPYLNTAFADMPEGQEQPVIGQLRLLPGVTYAGQQRSVCPHSSN